MNEIDPSHRYSLDAVRKFEGEDPRQSNGQINKVALQVASQYRRDKTSPVTVSGHGWTSS